jgi:hypothetical protein
MGVNQTGTRFALEPETIGPYYAGNRATRAAGYYEVGAVIGIVATADGKGYWEYTPDGDIYPFGDAKSYGSLTGTHLNQPIIGMAHTPDGKGYWLVAIDGGIFTYGDATFDGSAGGQNLAGPIVGMAATADGNGYWLVDSTGTVHSFGDATVLAGPSIPSGTTYIEGLSRPRPARATGSTAFSVTSTPTGTR